jgi:hypothetical protein
MLIKKSHIGSYVFIKNKLSARKKKSIQSKTILYSFFSYCVIVNTDFCVHNREFMIKAFICLYTFLLKPQRKSRDEIWYVYFQSDSQTRPFIEIKRMKT